MSCLKAVITEKNNLAHEEISVELSKEDSLHNAIMVLQTRVNDYLTKLVNQSGDEDFNDCCDIEESDEEDVIETSNKDRKRTEQTLKLNKKIKQ